MKIALLIAGELREFQVAKNFWPFLNIPNLDIYMSTWSTSIKDDPVNNEKITEVVDRDSLEKSLNFKKIIIEDLPHASAVGIHLYLYKIRGLIEVVVAENIEYDIVIVIRPDLIFTLFPSYDLVNHIVDNVKHDNIIHTITNNWKIADTKLTTDVLYIGTLNTFKKFLNFIPNHTLDTIPNLEHADIHSFLGKSYLENDIEVDNLPIYKWTIARPNSRGKINPTFEVLEKDAKIHWEYRYKKFFSSTENLYLSLNSKEPVVYPKVEMNKTLNLFDEFDYKRYPRAPAWVETDKELTWYSTDNETNCDNGLIAERHKYTKNDITYKFNSLGFRLSSCNYPLKFDDAYGYPTIMVSGCSVTEGVGLPEDHIWHSHLIEKFIKNNDTSRPIAKLNLAKGGSGTDGIVRRIYISIEKYGARPDLIYLLLPVITRQEIIVDDDMAYVTPILFKLLINSPRPAQSEFGSKTIFSENQKEFIEMKYKILINNARELYHNTFKSLLFLKYYLESKNIPWFFSSWSNDFTESGIKSYLPNIDSNDIKIPEAIQQHHFDIDFSTYNNEHKYHMARDGMHYGLPYHLQFSNNVYDKLMDNSIFLEIRNKWKT
jgi:hypothetical protein